jgi:hypothetical protein
VPRRFDEVAAYASSMDGNTICCHAGAAGWWSFGSPNKLQEALAAVKPAAASPLETILPFAHVADLADASERWIAAIPRALDSGGVGCRTGCSK